MSREAALQQFLFADKMCKVRLRNALDVPPEEIGIYSANDDANLPNELADLVVGVSPSEFASALRNGCPPKEILRSPSSMVPAHLALTLIAKGPCVSFNHPRFASLHALERARSDLLKDRISRAVVCAVSGELRHEAVAAVVGDLSGMSKLLSIIKKNGPIELKWGIATMLIQGLVDAERA
jgi:hypothetical protein